MTALAVRILAGLLRLSLTPIVGWLAAHNIILSSDETTMFVAEVSAFLVAAAWTIYAKVRDRQTLLTAQALPPTTANNVTSIVKAGNAPALSTLPTDVPRLQE